MKAIMILLMCIYLNTQIRVDICKEQIRIYNEQIYQLCLEKAMTEYDFEVELNKLRSNE